MPNFEFFIFSYWVSSLYILDINPNQIYEYRYVPPFFRLLFHFEDFFFTVQKLFRYSPTEYFCLCCLFIYFFFGVISRKLLRRSVSRSFSPMSSSRSLHFYGFHLNLYPKNRLTIKVQFHSSVFTYSVLSSFIAETVISLPNILGSFVKY